MREIDHIDDEYSGLQDPEEFLDRNHPENDQYMKSVEHVQRKIMHASSQLRHKQVQILKTVFTGLNFTDTAQKHHTTPSTVSRLVKSPNGQRLLNLLQYHLKLLEGPAEAQRRNMLWRIALKEEQIDPKTAIKAIEALNKMHFQQHTINQDESSADKPNVVININQDLLPKGHLDQ